MEFEININKNEQAYWIAALIAVAVLVSVVFGWIGSGVTPLDASGNPQVLSWSDWQLIKAEQIHSKELVVLQGDASQLEALLQSRPDPVTAQFEMNIVTRHAKEGTDPSLATARQALQTAATDVRDWASGALNQNTAIQSLETALGLLK